MEGMVQAGAQPLLPSALLPESVRVMVPSQRLTFALWNTPQHHSLAEKIFLLLAKISHSMSRK